MTVGQSFVLVALSIASLGQSVVLLIVVRTQRIQIRVAEIQNRVLRTGLGVHDFEDEA